MEEGNSGGNGENLTPEESPSVKGWLLYVLRKMIIDVFLATMVVLGPFMVIVPFAQYFGWFRLPARPLDFDLVIDMAASTALLIVMVLMLVEYIRGLVAARRLELATADLAKAKEELAEQERRRARIEQAKVIRSQGQIRRKD